MVLFFDIVYALAIPLVAPFVAIKSVRTGKYRSGWAGRFGLGGELFPDRTGRAKVLLLHCVSVGELLSVQTLVQRLLAADADLLIAITTTTDTGTARAQALYPATHGRVRALRFPLDFSFAVEAMFDRVRPDVVALVELETWPNFLAIAESRRIPVVLINGRISERSFPRYRLIRPIMGGMLGRLCFIGAQTGAIQKRFAALGAEPGRMEVIPTLKYDNAHFADSVPGQEELARSMGLAVVGPKKHLLFVGGSTGPGEEIPLLESYLALREKNPGLRLAIAPRKPESIPGLLEAIRGRGLSAILRTERGDGAAASSPLGLSQVFVLDTLGELKKLYALAFGVFVGRSLVKLGGSDMIEVAALAKPCCFGPHTANFSEVVDLLVGERCAVEVADGNALTETIGGWLRDPEAAGAMGRRAREVIELQRGATERYVVKLAELLRGKRGFSEESSQWPQRRG